LCVVADEWLFAFGAVTTRGQRFKEIKGVWHYSCERVRIKDLSNSLPANTHWEMVEFKAKFKGE
jgi:hypothetical protein